MKLLQIHAEFMLPDDFDGTLADALREMATYDESKEASDRRLPNGDENKLLSIIDWEIESLRTLGNKNKEDGTRSVVSYYIGEWE